MSSRHYNKSRVRKKTQVLNFGSSKSDLHSYLPVIVTARNNNQKLFIKALNDIDIPVVFAVGPAGCGKTWVSTKIAMSKFFYGDISKIIITRPNMAVDGKGIGHLPGEVNEKMMPWIAPIIDILKENLSLKRINNLLNSGIIEIVPIEYIRGRSFKDAWILCDESQNLSSSAMLSILTRIGENSKLIITGDRSQSDRGCRNGLSDFMHRFNENPFSGVQICKFTLDDVERHSIISKIINLYSD